VRRRWTSRIRRTGPAGEEKLGGPNHRLAIFRATVADGPPGVIEVGQGDREAAGIVDCAEPRTAGQRAGLGRMSTVAKPVRGVAAARATGGGTGVRRGARVGTGAGSDGVREHCNRRSTPNIGHSNSASGGGRGGEALFKAVVGLRFSWPVPTESRWHSELFRRLQLARSTRRASAQVHLEVLTDVDRGACSWHRPSRHFGPPQPPAVARTSNVLPSTGSNPSTCPVPPSRLRKPALAPRTGAAARPVGVVAGTRCDRPATPQRHARVCRGMRTYRARAKRDSRPRGRLAHSIRGTRP
jgi:hypothetical protein